jgi:hypothetical protein
LRHVPRWPRFARRWPTRPVSRRWMSRIDRARTDVVIGDIALTVVPGDALDHSHHGGDEPVT